MNMPVCRMVIADILKTYITEKNNYCGNNTLWILVLNSSPSSPRIILQHAVNLLASTLQADIILLVFHILFLLLIALSITFVFCISCINRLSHKRHVSVVPLSVGLMWQMTCVPWEIKVEFA